MGTPQSTSRPVWWAMGIVVVLLTLNWVAAIARFQVEGLYWDQWVYCQPLFAEDAGWLDIFMRQLGPHRQGLAFLLTVPVMHLAGWDTRIEALWITLWLVVATVLALAWKRRLTGRLGWEDLWVPLALLSVRQLETVFIVPNLSHSVFPLVLLMGMAWVAIGPMTPRRWLGFGVLGAVSLFTGFGIFALVAGVWIIGVRILRAWWTRDFSGLTWPLVCAGMLALALVGFLQDYHLRSGSGGTAAPIHLPLSDYALFMARMLASRMDMAGGSPTAVWVGWFVLGLAVVVFGHASWRMFRDREISPGMMVALLLLGTALSYGFFTAFGRIHLSVKGADAPRYVTLIGMVWLGFMAWASTRSRRGWVWAAAMLGWSSVMMSWVDLPRRPLASWPGTLGMSEVSHNAIGFPNRHKMMWLLTWEESGDWRKAEERAPRGIFGEPESLRLGERIDWLAERGLTFADPDNGPLDWLPWWSPLGYTWIKGMGGEHRQWIEDEAILFIEGHPVGFMNLRFNWRAPAMPPAGQVQIELGDYTAVVDSDDLIRGLSLPAPRERTKLVLRSLAGSVPLNPPADPRLASYLMENPTFSEEPTYAIGWWTEDGAGLWGEDYSEVISGRWNWEKEPGGEFVWTDATLVLQSRSRLPTYWNIEFEDRYDPVDEGPVMLRWDDQEVELPWDGGILRVSVPMRAGVSHRLEVINVAGARSPKDEGESGDARNLAMRLTLLEFAAEPRFELVDPGHEN